MALAAHKSPQSSTVFLSSFPPLRGGGQAVFSNCLGVATSECRKHASYARTSRMRFPHSTHLDTMLVSSEHPSSTTTQWLVGLWLASFMHITAQHGGTYMREKTATLFLLATHLLHCCHSLDCTYTRTTYVTTHRAPPKHGPPEEEETRHWSGTAWHSASGSSACHCTPMPISSRRRH